MRDKSVGRPALVTQKTSAQRAQTSWQQKRRREISEAKARGEPIPKKPVPKAKTRYVKDLEDGRVFPVSSWNFFGVLCLCFFL